MAMAGKFVAYYRVSTQKQGGSRLGIEAQKSAVREYLERVQGLVVPDGEFTEVESRRSHQNRPELEKAVTLAKLTSARLIVASLDRLSSDGEFLAKLQKSSVGSVLFADMPEAGPLQVGIMALLAQHELDVISKRTKAALAEARKRGTKKDGTPFKTASGKLGPTLKAVAAIQAKGDLGRRRSLAIRQGKANDFAKLLAPVLDAIVLDLRTRGGAKKKVAQKLIAEELNRREIRTPRGTKTDGAAFRWTPAGAGRLMKRVKSLRRRGELAERDG